MSEPAALVQRRDHLRERLAGLDARIRGKQDARDKAEEAGDEDLASLLSHDVGVLLKMSADVVDHLNDLERPNIVALYEQQEREAGAPRGGGDAAKARRDAPAGLAEGSLEEIVYTLRTKLKWTFQEVVDWLVANDVKRRKAGDTKWHTSQVYAIWKKGYTPAR